MTVLDPREIVGSTMPPTRPPDGDGGGSDDEDEPPYEDVLGLLGAGTGVRN